MNPTDIPVNIYYLDRPILWCEEWIAFWNKILTINPASSKKEVYQAELERYTTYLATLRNV